MVRGGTDKIRHYLIRAWRFMVQTGIFYGDKDILCYWSEGVGVKNFGDMISKYILTKVTGRPPKKVNSMCRKKHYFGCGSILNNVNHHSIVWGSGIIDRLHGIKDPLKICSVRGKYSRQKCISLGIDCPEKYGDLGLILPLIYTPKTRNEGLTGIIQNWAEYKYVKENLDKLKEKGQCTLIDPLQPLEIVIDNINRCKKVVSSSLHGIILAHAYGIEAYQSHYTSMVEGDGIKFLDYFSIISHNPPDKREIAEIQESIIDASPVFGKREKKKLKSRIRKKNMKIQITNYQRGGEIN